MIVLPPPQSPSIPFVRIVGDLPEFKEGSEPTAISADASVVVGIGRPDVNTYLAFRWSAETGTILLGNLGGRDGLGRFSHPSGVSNDGSVVVGNCSSPDGDRPFWWSEKTGLIPLPVPKSSTSSSGVFAMTADGKTIFGWSGDRSSDPLFRWTVPTGPVPLDFKVGAESRPTIHAVSADGTVIVGDVERRSPEPQLSCSEGFRWTAAGGFKKLGFLPGCHVSSSMAAVSADGSTIVGWSTGETSRDVRAVRWTAKGGMVPLVGPGGSEAEAVSEDGAVIVGWCQGEGGFGGFIWTERTGMLDLRKLVAAQTPLPREISSLSPKALTVTPDGTAYIAAEGFLKPSGSCSCLIAIPVPR